MNAKTKLANWLFNNKRDYQLGVEIFMELRIDPSKNHYLYTRTPTKVHCNILEKELVNYARIYNIKAVSSAGVKKVIPNKTIKTTNELVASKPVNVKLVAPNHENVSIAASSKKLTAEQVLARSGKLKIDPNPIVRLEDLSEEMKGLYFENGELSAKMKTLHAELKIIADDESQKQRRADIAVRIVDYEKKWRENWDAIDAWWEENKTSTPEKIAAEEALWKDKQIDSDLNYIRRYYTSTKVKQQEEVKKRMDRLDGWGVDYGRLVEKIST